MNKVNFIRSISHKCHATHRQSAQFVNAIFGKGSDPGGIAECLIQEGSLSLGGFGTFKTALSPAYGRIHPQTQQPIILPPTVRVLFIPRSALQRVLKSEINLDDLPLCNSLEGGRL